MYLANHLWQSTLFAAMIALLAIALRRNRAQTRYWLWFAASIKFLIPFSVLVSAGALFEWRRATAVTPALTHAVEQISQPFAPVTSARQPAPGRPDISAILITIWISGSAFLSARWWRRWRQIQTALRTASRLPIAAPIPVLSSPALIEP